jgi:hypothetical protein
VIGMQSAPATALAFCLSHSAWSYLVWDANRLAPHCCAKPRTEATEMAEHSEFKPTVCVDLDGVLNMYDGWKGADHFAPPRPGARAFMAALAERYTVVVLTSRVPIDTEWWLKTSGIPFSAVASEKPPALAYIDDRAICFTGDFDGLVERVASFKAHWED